MLNAPHYPVPPPSARPGELHARTVTNGMAEKVRVSWRWQPHDVRVSASGADFIHCHGLAGFRSVDALLLHARCLTYGALPPR
ncbi:MAG: hypothetical protein QOI30_3070 [Mycobacterium sp.]|nr:hypothetical protein [Mycobacterium sp.]